MPLLTSCLCKAGCRRVAVRLACSRQVGGSRHHCCLQQRHAYQSPRESTICRCLISKSDTAIYLHLLAISSRLHAWRYRVPVEPIAAVLKVLRDVTGSSNPPPPTSLLYACYISVTGCELREIRSVWAYVALDDLGENLSRPRAIRPHVWRAGLPVPTGDGAEPTVPVVSADVSEGVAWHSHGHASHVCPT